jgi:hypothetical protein
MDTSPQTQAVRPNIIVPLFTVGVLVVVVGRRHRDGIAKVPRLCSSLDRVSRDCPVVCDRVSFERSKRKLCTCWHLIGRRASHERSVSGSERTADALQRPALGGNREERADQCRGEHQHRAEQVAAENAPA